MFKDTNFESYSQQSEASIKRKVEAEKAEGKDCKPKDLKDIVRTTIIVPRSAIEGVIKDLSTTKHFLRYKPQSGSAFLGYSGNIINVLISNGLVAEIQVNTPKMIYAKEQPDVAKKILGEKVWNEIRKQTGTEGGFGHMYYEEYRKLSKEEQNSEKGLAIKKESENYYSHFTK